MEDFTEKDQNQIKKGLSTAPVTDQDISEEDRQLILTAAVNAPTAGNQQLYTILNFDTEKRVKR